MTTYALTDRAVVLKAEDDVAIAKKELTAGSVLEDGPTHITVRVDIKPGHKVARHAVAARQPVRRYGQVIGFATQDIQVGDHVHSHNLDIGELSSERYEIGVDVKPVTFYPRDNAADIERAAGVGVERCIFYVPADGRAAALTKLDALAKLTEPYRK